jgi:hypothetical protein
MHRRFIDAVMTRDATSAFLVSLGLGLSDEAWLRRLRVGARAVLQGKQKNESDEKSGGSGVSITDGSTEFAPPHGQILSQRSSFRHLVLAPGMASELKSHIREK